MTVIVVLTGATTEGFVNGILSSDGGVCLCKTDLTNCDMTNTDFCEDATEIEGISAGVTLDASVQDANLNGADFTNATCKWFNADRAVLQNFSAVGANLTGAAFTDADLTGCNVNGADLSYVDARGVTVNNGDAADIIAAAEAKFS